MSFHRSIIRSGATDKPAASISFNYSGSGESLPARALEESAQTSLITDQNRVALNPVDELIGIELTRPFN